MQIAIAPPIECATNTTSDLSSSTLASIDRLDEHTSTTHQQFPTRRQLIGGAMARTIQAKHIKTLAVAHSTSEAPATSKYAHVQPPPCRQTSSGNSASLSGSQVDRAYRPPSVASNTVIVDRCMLTSTVRRTIKDPQVRHH
jgi:hypothetical protein